MDREDSNTWRAKDVELVESFVSRAAVALENARLYKQLEWAAALEERQRIAADLHDGLAQIISLLGFKVDNISEMILSGNGVEIAAALEDIRETVGHASVEARKSISSLQSTPQPRKSFQEILKALVDQWEKEWAENNGAVIITSLSFSEPLILPPNHITQIVPIIKEAVINARKHAGASQIEIKGKQIENHVNISIEDNGRGFSVDELTGLGDKHFGLKIMRARAARFGGELEISSDPNAGTIVSLSWLLGSDQAGKMGRLLESSIKE